MTKRMGNPNHVKSGPNGGQFTGGSSGNAAMNAAIRNGAGRETINTMSKFNAIKVDDIVEFKHPLADEVGKDGKQIPMQVLEINGDRALVKAHTSGIQPTKVVPLAALQKYKMPQYTKAEMEENAMRSWAKIIKNQNAMNKKARAKK